MIFWILCFLFWTILVFPLWIYCWILFWTTFFSEVSSFDNRIGLWVNFKTWNLFGTKIYFWNMERQSIHRRWRTKLYCTVGICRLHTNMFQLTHEVHIVISNTMNVTPEAQRNLIHINKTEGVQPIGSPTTGGHKHKNSWYSSAHKGPHLRDDDDGLDPTDLNQDYNGTRWMNLGK